MTVSETADLINQLRVCEHLDCPVCENIRDQLDRGDEDA